MKLQSVAIAVLSGASVANAIYAPPSRPEPRSELAAPVERSPWYNIFEKRKGGGGRSSSSSGGSSSSSSGGSSSSSGGSRSSNSLPSSNSGGTSRGGSGTPRAFGGSSFYGGGSKVPYRSGSRSPRGIVPIFIPAAILIAAYPGIWSNHGAYYYEYEATFENQTLDDGDGGEQTRDVVCFCQRYQVCGCDENDDDDYIEDVIGNGAYDQLDKSLVTVGEFEGEEKLLLNGTLPNGTTADEDSWATGDRRSLLQHASWAVVATGIFYSMWVM